MKKKNMKERMNEYMQSIKHMDGRVINESMDRLTQTLQLELLERIANTLDVLKERKIL